MRLAEIEKQISEAGKCCHKLKKQTAACFPMAGTRQTRHSHHPMFGQLYSPEAFEVFAGRRLRGGCPELLLSQPKCQKTNAANQSDQG